MKVAYKEDIATNGNKPEQLYHEMPKLSSNLLKVTLAGGIVLYVAPVQASSTYVQDVVKPRIEMISNFKATTILTTQDLALPRLSKELSIRMRSIASLQENWDGYGASAISATIIRNTRTFLRTLQAKGIKIEDSTNIYPTPYGTVVIEVNNNRGLVSMEIDRHRIGFFTDYRASGNWGAEGIDTDFKEIPEQLRQHLS
jgi:hypothetical protein